jgi:CheY-like chemotaxis protein
MKKSIVNRIRIILADDDRDDRFFFNKAIQETGLPVDLLMLEDGESLMKHLEENQDLLPDVIFLDLNMPRKNGSECLKAIKKDSVLQKIPVIIYSTSLHEEVADLLYQSGAHFYIRKTEFKELKKILTEVVELISAGKLVRPPRDKFILKLKTLNHF